MSSEFSRLLTALLNEYTRLVYKHNNFTDTYSTAYLEKFITVVRDLTMFQHSIEDREAQAEAWNIKVDRLAEEDEEYRIQQINKRKDSNNGKM